MGEIKGKVLLFYNPFAGKGVISKNLDRIIERFQREGLVVIPARSSREFMDINDIIRNLDDSYVKIIAAGGDGTVNIVVNAMIENGCTLPLAVFPAGTANDYAHYFGIPSDIDGMLEIAAGDRTVPADVGCCNGRYFVNVAAIGSVIDVSQKTNAGMKNAMGVLAYYLKGLSELPALHPVSVKITTPEREFTEDIFFMVVLNGSSAGGFRKLGLDTSINDGLLEVIIFKGMKFLQMPGVGINVLRGKHDSDENVIYFKTSSIRIESDVDISTDIDGEHGQPLPLDISVLSGGINICVNHDVK